MKVKIVYSTQETVDKIVSDLKAQLKDFDYNLVQFYASSNINPEELSKKLHEALGGVPTFGCTTSGEIVSGQMLDNSVVLMAMSPAIVADCKIEILENISTYKLVVDNAFESFKNHFGEDLATLNPHSHVGFVMTDGLSKKEEFVNERIGDLTNIAFVGGSAGDDLKFKTTYVFANGKTYTDAAVVCLIKSNVKFDILKTQSFKSVNKKLTVTEIDEPNRRVVKFNGKPALDEYLEATGSTKNNLNQTFSKNPVGLDIGGDFLVRSPRVAEGTDMLFYCSVKQGMNLDLLEAQNIVEDTKRALDSKLKEFGKVTALINFNCILRTLELKAKNQTQAYADLFKDIPTVGFTTYGESYIGHINQTSVILLFGE